MYKRVYIATYHAHSQVILYNFNLLLLLLWMYMHIAKCPYIAIILYVILENENQN